LDKFQTIIYSYLFICRIIKVCRSELKLEKELLVQNSISFPFPEILTESYKTHWVRVRACAYVRVCARARARVVCGINILQTISE